MRTLLRKTSTAVYFQGPDRWTQNPGEAFNFRSIDRALQFVRRWNLQNVELVFGFQDEDEVKEVEPAKLNIRFAE